MGSNPGDGYLIVHLFSYDSAAVEKDFVSHTAGELLSCQMCDSVGVRI